ncbi:MAG: chemotaxis protein CheD [Halorientalis sp.]
MKVYDGTSETSAEPQQQRLKVGIAEYEVTTAGADLTTSGLGSCLGIAMYDETAGVAGLVHIMLPSAAEVDDSNEAKFADTGIELLIDEMEQVGASTRRIEAKVAGGSDMLDFSENGSGIGVRNIEQVEETLSDLDIPIVSQDVGGDHGRSLKLDGSTGDLTVKSANKGSQVI